MKRLCGLIIFSMGVGMAILLFVPTTLTTLVFVLACLILGYNLFCC
ncbi:MULTISPECIES: hypothetical protein [unclassified Clostridium]|nr:MULTISPECIES: hypothetical protein [unclassified Clostridium]MBS6646022.1 hypothetical protein [Clostridiaceae bacterium]